MDKKVLWFINGLKSNRSTLFGIAMILVVIYHVYCNATGWRHFALSPFFCGYIGVDIFLLLSGFGLCYSYDKYSLKDFYIRRFSRILPLFIIMKLLSNMLFQVREGIWDLLCECSAILTFYNLGGTGIDWFTAAILQFYIFFPILYIIGKKYPKLLTIMSHIVVVVLLLMIGGQMIPEHLFFISRIPIFCLGVSLYHVFKTNENLSFFGYIYIILAVLGLCFLVYSYKIMRFYSFSLLCPFLLVLICSSLEKYKHKKYMIGIKTIGNKSLEIYYGNGTALLAKSFSESNTIVCLLYIALTVFFSWIYSAINNEFSKLLKKK